MEKSNENRLNEIKEKVNKKTAVVLTKDEFLNSYNKNNINHTQVDVVTCATKGIMSGTFASLSFKIEEPKIFKKVQNIWLNDVPGVVGPCPNEFLGIVDLLVLGTSHSISNPKKYGGGHLFRDLVEGKEIVVKVLTTNGKEFHKKISINDIDYAKLYGTRHAFRNYLAFVNPSNEAIDTIFSVSSFDPNNKWATFCGCGTLNPLENDPYMRFIKKGTQVLINGSLGMVTDTGTRSSPEKPNLSTVGDLKTMDPEYLGGFITSAGPEVICSFAAAIPVVNEETFKGLIRNDKEIDLYVTDVKGRDKIGKTNYGDVWFNNYYVKFEGSLCIHCDTCNVQKTCPTGAFDPSNGKDDRRCFQCGHCVTACLGAAFQCDLGDINLNGEMVPVMLRQSDRLGAQKLAQKLKMLIEKGEFQLPC